MDVPERNTTPEGRVGERESMALLGDLWHAHAMSSPVRNARTLRLSALGVAVCVCALLLGLSHGLEHNPRFASMLLVDLVLGLGMANRLRRELQRPAR